MNVARCFACRARRHSGVGGGGGASAEARFEEGLSRGTRWPKLARGKENSDIFGWLAHKIDKKQFNCNWDHVCFRLP